MKKEGDILITDKEVDPDLEITGIQKQAGRRLPDPVQQRQGQAAASLPSPILFGDMNVINKMFGWKDHADRTRKLAYAITHPIAPDRRRSKRRAGAGRSLSKSRRKPTITSFRSAIPTSNPN